MCRRYQPDEDDIEKILYISEDPQDSSQIQAREQLKSFGQQLLTDFENGITPSEELDEISASIAEEAGDI